MTIRIITQAGTVIYTPIYAFSIIDYMYSVDFNDAQISRNCAIITYMLMLGYFNDQIIYTA